MESLSHFWLAPPRSLARPRRASRRFHAGERVGSKTASGEVQYRHPGCKKPAAKGKKTVKRIGASDLADMYEAGDAGQLAAPHPKKTGTKKVVKKKVTKVPNPYAGLE